MAGTAVVQETDSSGSDRPQEAAPGVTQVTSGCCVYREQPLGKLGRGGMCLTNNGLPGLRRLLSG